MTEEFFLSPIFSTQNALLSKDSLRSYVTSRTTSHTHKRQRFLTNALQHDTLNILFAFLTFLSEQVSLCFE